MRADLSERQAELLLAGVVDAAPELVVALDAIRDMSTADVPEPAGELALLLESGFTPARPARPARPQPPLRLRRLRVRLATTATAAVATFSGMATAGALPAPLQQWASDTATRVNLTLPAPDATRADDHRDASRPAPSHEPTMPVRDVQGFAEDRRPRPPEAVSGIPAGERADRRDARRAEAERHEESAEVEQDRREEAAEAHEDRREQAADIQRRRERESQDAAEDAADDAEDRADDTQDAEDDAADDAADAAEDAEDDIAADD